MAKSVKNVAPKMDEKFTHKFDPVLLEKELPSLTKEASGSISATLLTKWVGADINRKLFLSDSVFGSIRWPKALGRPLHFSLAEGFEIEHVHFEEKLMYTPNGYQIIQLLAPQPAPSKWDAENTGEYYQVNFMTEAREGYVQRITVSFADNVRWDRPGLHTRAGYRDIPAPQRTFKKEKGLLVLPPFKVVKKFF